MTNIRRLDRTRPYGTIYPAQGPAAFAQDHLEFDVEGRCLDPGAPPLKPAQTNGAPEKGAVSLSGFDTTIPHTVMELKTVQYFQLINAMKRDHGHAPKNRVAAIAFLDSKNLVKKD